MGEVVPLLAQKDEEELKEERCRHERQHGHLVSISGAWRCPGHLHSSAFPASALEVGGAVALSDMQAAH